MSRRCTVRSAFLVSALLAVGGCGDQSSVSSDTAAGTTFASSPTVDATVVDGTVVEEEYIEDPWDFERAQLPDLGSFDELAKQVDALLVGLGVHGVLLDPTATGDQWAYKLSSSSADITTTDILLTQTIASAGATEIERFRQSGWEVTEIDIAGFDGPCGVVHLDDALLLQCRVGNTNALISGRPGLVDVDRLVAIAMVAVQHGREVGPADGSTMVPSVYVPDPFFDAHRPFGEEVDTIDPDGTEYDSFDALAAAAGGTAQAVGMTFTAYDPTSVAEEGRYVLFSSIGVLLTPELVVGQSVGAPTDQLLDSQLASITGDVTTSHLGVGGVPCATVHTAERSTLICVPTGMTVWISMPPAGADPIEVINEQLIAAMRTLLAHPVPLG